jgi:hypothetical protein
MVVVEAMSDEPVRAADPALEPQRRFRLAVFPSAPNLHGKGSDRHVGGAATWIPSTSTTPAMQHVPQLSVVALETIEVRCPIVVGPSATTARSLANFLESPRELDEEALEENTLERDACSPTACGARSPPIRTSAREPRRDVRHELFVESALPVEIGRKKPVGHENSGEKQETRGTRLYRRLCRTATCRESLDPPNERCRYFSTRSLLTLPERKLRMSRSLLARLVALVIASSLSRLRSWCLPPSPRR